MLTWDPDRNFFTIPYIDHPVTWYGFLFAFGFVLGYSFIGKIFKNLLSRERSPTIDSKAQKLTDRLTGLIIAGTLIGARLGHVFFYEWSYYRAHPTSIFKVWEGGLASHGAVIGIILALSIFLFWNKKEFENLTFFKILDIIVIPAALIGGFIRIGNFINQEITGIPTSLPWGVIFLHPVDGRAGIPLHPVQIYESLFYFFTFSTLWLLWKKRANLIGQGLFSGLFFILIFGFRFFIESIKTPQNLLFDATSFLKMGQLLSIPLIMIGIVLVGRFIFLSSQKKYVSET